MIDPCPCGRAARYADCCGRYLSSRSPGRPKNDLAHSGGGSARRGEPGALPTGAPAPDAEALMRSRYTAYVRGDEAYLLATWHPATRPARLGLADETPPRWLGLQVKRHTAIDTNHAEVEFVARFKVAGRAHRLHEVSRFERLDGRWYYLDGVHD